MVYTVDEAFPIDCFSGVKLRRRIHMTMCTYFSTFRFIIIFWTSIFLQDAQAIRNSFKVVDRCPFNESEWKVRAAHTTCNGSESYHCLLTEGRDLLREQCTEASLFTSGFCPIFTNEGYLQWSPCKNTACPTSSYRSDEVYQYQICYGKTDNPKGGNKEQGSNNSGSISVTVMVIITVAILLFFILVMVLLVVFYKLNQFGFRDNVQQRITAIQKHFHLRSTEVLQDNKTRESSEELSQLLKNDIKLNSVEKGIVITENIYKALGILKSRNVVVLRGAIGCGKTYALKAIENYFQELNKETAYLESENMLEEISNKKQTILFCDNLFGKFGSSVFSQNAVDITEHALEEIERSEQETKVVIGIHTHVYDEVMKNLNLRFLNQKHITVEMDNLSQAETLMIFKEQLKRGHCKIDSSCWFKRVEDQSVLGKLLKNKSHIGSPFLSLMFCIQHQLFFDAAFTDNPVQALLEHIEKVKKASRIQYDCLIYLMCNQQHNIKKEPKKWAREISANITKDNLKELIKTSGFIQFENERMTLAHELLTIALFKHIERPSSFLSVLQMRKKLSRHFDSIGIHTDL